MSMAKKESDHLFYISSWVSFIILMITITFANRNIRYIVDKKPFLKFKTQYRAYRSPIHILQIPYQYACSSIPVSGRPVEMGQV